MDSDNILSILAALGQGSAPAAQTNVLQSVAPPVGVAAALAPAAPPPAAPIAPPMVPPPAAKAPEPAEPPRKRRSVIETIGRLADVFAKVGGAEALYQPTLDARQNQMTQVDMDALRAQLLKQQVAGGTQEVEATERKRIGTALGALVGRQNAAELWPSVAEQAGIDPQKTAAIGQILQANPDAAGIFAKSLGADIENLGKNVYFGTDPEGKTVAYQVGPDGRPHVLDFGGQITPSDPLKVVNTGGSNVVLGSGGGIRRILPNTARPDTILTTNTQREIAAGNNRTQITVAGIKGSGSGKTGGGADPAMVETAQGNLNELRSIYRDLNKMGAMVSPKKGTVENIAARVRASGVGQIAEGAVGTQAQTLRDRVSSIRPGLMQSLAKATGMTGKQLDSNADVKLFMQTVTNPAASYEANMKAIEGLERFLKANTKKAPAASTPVRPKAQSGWSIVGVK